MSRVTSVCSSPRVAYVESGTCTRYPTPPTSTTTWFGRLPASLPRSWPIIGVEYCRFFFACQRGGGVLRAEGKLLHPVNQAADRWTRERTGVGVWAASALSGRRARTA